MDQYIEDNPMMVKDKISTLYLKYGTLSVVDGGLVLMDGDGMRIKIPVARISTLYLEPGTTVTRSGETVFKTIVSIMLGW